MNKIIKKNYFLMVISFLLALTLWGIAMKENNPNSYRTLNPKAVQISESGYGPNNVGLTLLEGENQTVTVRLNGYRNTLFPLTASLSVKVDLTGITEAGTYEVPVLVGVSDPAIKVTSVTPKNISVTLDHIESKEIPVRVSVKGSVSGQIESDKIAATPSIITVTGPKKELDTIHYAHAEVNVTDIKEDTVVSSSITLINGGGEVVNSKYLTVDQNQVEIKVPTLMVKTVPLKVSTKGELGKGLWLLSYTPAVEMITIGAKEDVLSTTEYIELEPVDLTTVTQTDEVEVKVVLPYGVKNLTKTDKIKVKLTIENYENKELLSSAVQVTNYGENNVVSATQETMTVVLSGPPSVLSTLTSEDVAVRVNMGGEYTRPDTYVMRAEVFVVGHPEVVALGTYDVEVVVRDIEE